MANLIPVYTKECLPGDKWNGNAEALIRLVPMVAPAMHKMEIFFHAFYVPYRLLWPSWELLITGGQMGDIPPALPVKKPALGQFVEPGSLDNYLGLPVTSVSTVQLPFTTAFRWAAYQRIWFDWYRDQNLQNVGNDFPWMLKDGDNAAAFGGFQTELETMRKRAWEHDYFTSALPFVQKGAAVGIPIDFAGLEILARAPGASADNPFNPIWRSSVADPPFAQEDAITGVAGSTRANTNAFGSSTIDNGAGTHQFAAYYDPLGGLYAAGTAFSTINDLRAAQALQRWLEKNARGGTRYTEALRVHFGVISSDARLQRAEYLGGSKSVLAISEVLQTSSTDGTSPQGNMAGHGISVTGGSLFNYRCEEHGQLMIIMSVRPKSAYYQGIPRELLKQDLQDFYFQDFASLGEQPVYNAELVVTGNPVTDMATFGYLPRYAEYRVEHNRVAGQMVTTLEYWQLGRKFSTGATPPLNEDFIVCDPSKRIFAVDDPDEDELICHIIFKIYARRPIPQYGTPL